MTELVTKLDLEGALVRLTLRTTVRFGVMLVSGFGALAAVLKLAQFVGRVEQSETRRLGGLRRFAANLPYDSDSRSLNR
jgi:hypothetical protein